MTEILTLPACEIKPFDGLTEGTIVTEVRYHHVTQQDPITGEVTQRPIITAYSVLARFTVIDFGGRFLHALSQETVDERNFEPDEDVRLARPAPVAPCSCGCKP